MQALTAILAAFAAGAVLATLVTYRVLTVRYDLTCYRQLRVHETRWRDIVADSDHNHRLAQRWERRHNEARAQIGDLVLALDRERARRRGRRRNPMPTYGTHRTAT